MTLQASIYVRLPLLAGDLFIRQNFYGSELEFIYVIEN